MFTSRSLTRLAALAAGSLSLVTLTSAAAAAPLSATSAITVVPSASLVSSPASILGDFNGDGKDDFVVTSDGKVHVVFGASTYSAVDIAAGGPRVRTFDGVPGYAVSAAGDFDHDGYDDFIAVSQGGTTASVVYGGPGGAGSTTPTPGNGLTTLNTGQLTLPRISGGGDLNGDGYDDVLVAWNASNNNQSAVAIAYGGPRVAAITVNAQNARASLLRGPRVCGYVNVIFQVCTTTTIDATFVGDFNGDGKDDLFVAGATGSVRKLFLGRTGTFSVTSPSLGTTGTVNLAPRLAVAGNTNTTDVFGVGDVDGDGKDDLAIPIRPETSSLPFQSVLLGRANPPASFTATEPAIELAYDGPLRILGPAGDQDGDGRGDLHLSTYLDAAADQILTDVPTASQPGRIAALPSLAGTPFGLQYSRRVGDVDGDGKPDLLASNTNQVILLTHGDDHYAPQLSNYRTELESTNFPATAGTKLSVNVSTDADIELKVTQDGAPVSVESRFTSRTDTTLHPWLPKVGGQPLPAGSYVLTLTPVDAAGNRGASLTRPFSVVDAPTAAIVDHKTTVYGPGGEYGGGLNVFQRWKCPAPSEGSYNGNGVDLIRTQAQAGDLCSLSATFDAFTGTGTLPPGYENCTWKVSLTFNGVPQADGLAPVTLVAGQNTLIQRYDCETPTTGSGVPPTSITDAGWRRVGGAFQPAGTGVLRLTTAEANKTTSAFWPQPVDWRERTVTFTAQMSGGNGAAEGLTLAFLPASGAFPAGGFLGGGSGKLGFGGLTGTAIALDVFKQDTDPQANLVGIAQTTTASSLNYLSWADAGVRLRSGVVTVKVVSHAGNVTVFVNGSQRISRALTLPSSGYVGFTAATGPTVYQQTDIRSIAVAAS